MERKIGEIFEYKGEWYQCVPNKECNECAFHGDEDKCCMTECSIIDRSDSTSVVFMKLEKVGEPYGFQKRTFQTYKLHTIPFLLEDVKLVALPSKDNKTIEIEIKQTKEDMEEKNDVKLTPLEKLVIDFFNNKVSDIEFEKRVSELYAKHSNSENIGKNMREFNLEAAKAGKPVCTRDGRKARVICFDRKHCHKGHDYPIVALISEGCHDEFLCSYTKDGLFAPGECYNTDLMMLPEKKEGWVNVYKGGLLDTKSYNTKKEAFDKASPEDYVDTVKINWSE